MGDGPTAARAFLYEIITVISGKWRYYTRRHFTVTTPHRLQYNSCSVQVFCQYDTAALSLRM